VHVSRKKLKRIGFRGGTQEKGYVSPKEEAIHGGECWKKFKGHGRGLSGRVRKVLNRI